MPKRSDARVGRIVAIFLVAVVLVPALAGAKALPGNGRAEQRERAVALPGQARTEARLLQLSLGKALDRGETAVNLGQITAEAAKAGGLFSELIIEGLSLGGRVIPTIAFHSDADAAQQAGDDIVINVKREGLDSSLALADWYLDSGDAVGAVSRLDLLSGSVQIPGVGLKANIGERGFSSQVTKDMASARFAITVEDLKVTLDSLLPDQRLPIGTSLDLITRLQLPMGRSTGVTVERLVRLMRDLSLVEGTLNDIDSARDALHGLGAESPTVKAALVALGVAESAAADAAANLAAAVAGIGGLQDAVTAANAARDAADAAVAAAAQDVTNATATVNGLQAQVASLDAEIAALQTELATSLDPARLLALPGEIAAKQAARAAAQTSLASAQAARTNLVAILSGAQTTAVAKQAAAGAAQASLAAAQAAVASATTAVANAQSALVSAQNGADAALAAAAVNNAALGALARKHEQLTDRLELLLQGVSDLLATLPPLPLIEQNLDEALRASEVLSVGGIRLESMVEADANGSRNLVHCKVEEVLILGYRPRVEECNDLIAVEKEAVRRVNEVLLGLGAVGVEGVQLLGPGGTWSTPGPVGADGVARSEGQMSALTLAVPSVRLDGVAANALAQLSPLLEMIQARPAAAIMLPSIQPGAAVRGVRAMGPASPGTEPATLGEQLQQVDDELAKTQASDALEGASTGSVSMVVAQARTVAEYDVNRLKKNGTTDPASLCDGDPVCLAKCAAGQCPSAAGETPAGSGPGSGTAVGPGGSGRTGSGQPGSGSDSVNLPLPGDGSDAKLPVTGAAGGLAGVALLAMSGAGAHWLRRRPVDGALDRRGRQR